MRHKYETRGIVLARSSLGEANALITLITPEIGLVRARAQGLRRSGAKLASALATFAESDVVLVRGKENWRIAGAVLVNNWSRKIPSVETRSRAVRISGLLLRLVAGEAHDTELFAIIREFFQALASFPEEINESAEILAALRILAVLGFDKGGIFGKAPEFTQSLLSEIKKNRTSYIARINHGIEASGL